MSETTICNRALSAMGTRSTIVSLAEESNEAEQCLLHYATVRDEVLQQALWNFARRAVVLAVHKAVPGTPEGGVSSQTVWSDDWPAPPWLYSYTYPQDCVRLRYIMVAGTSGESTSGVPIFGTASGRYDAYLTANPPIRFVIANEPDVSDLDKKVILTDVAQAMAIYTRRVENTTLWDPLFSQAVVYALATKLAVPLTGDKDLLKNNFELYKTTIASAREADGNEGLTVQDPLPDWLAARGLSEPSVVS